MLSFPDGAALCSGGTLPMAATKWRSLRDALRRVRCIVVNVRRIKYAKCGHDGAWPSRSLGNMDARRVQVAP